MGSLNNIIGKFPEKLVVVLHAIINGDKELALQKLNEAFLTCKDNFQSTFAFVTEFVENRAIATQQVGELLEELLSICELVHSDLLNFTTDNSVLVKLVGSIGAVHARHLLAMNAPVVEEIPIQNKPGFKGDIAYYYGSMRDASLTLENNFVIPREQVYDLVVPDGIVHESLKHCKKPLSDSLSVKTGECYFPAVVKHVFSTENQMFLSDLFIKLDVSPAQTNQIKKKLISLNSKLKALEPLKNTAGDTSKIEKNKKSMADLIIAKLRDVGVYGDLISLNMIEKIKDSHHAMARLANNVERNFLVDSLIKGCNCQEPVEMICSQSLLALLICHIGGSVQKNALLRIVSYTTQEELVLNNNEIHFGVAAKILNGLAKVQRCSNSPYSIIILDENNNKLMRFSFEAYWANNVRETKLTTNFYLSFLKRSAYKPVLTKKSNKLEKFAEEVVVALQKIR